MKISIAARRRILAAIALYGIAVCSVVFWNGLPIDWRMLGINLATATAGMAFLHVRWRNTEKQAMTPRKMKDIFS